MDEVCRPFFYVCLLAFVVWQLGTALFKTSQFFTSSTVTSEGVCQLDSFSQPSIATAILKQEADRLLGAYGQNRDQRVVEIVQSRVEVGNQNPPGADQLPPTAFEHPASDPSTIQPLEKLQRSIQDLSSDLDRKLMLVYYQSRLWNEFLDRYLHFLHTEPQNALVLNWAWCALGCAQTCERTDEVLDEFDHLIRFHQEFKTVRGLKTTLDQWRATHPHNTARLYPSAHSLNPVTVSLRLTPSALREWGSNLEGVNRGNLDVGQR